MLVLARDVNQSIECTGPCRITVIQIRPGMVRIGLTGPEETEFVRTELTGKNSEEQHTEEKT